MKNDTTSNYVSVTTASLLPYTSANLITLLEQHKLSQKDLAKITGVAESTLSAIRNGKIMPTIDFLYALKANFNISIDDFISKYLYSSDLSEPLSSELENSERHSYQLYCGTYFVYYFDTSKYKGRDFNTPGEALVYGILHIYENPTSLNQLDYSCLAILGITDRNEVIKLKEEVEKIKDISLLLEYANIEYASKCYMGKFELSRYHAFLSMSDKSKDKMLAIFHRAPSDKSNYTGGIGTINSVSKGRESMPVIQFLGMSRKKLALSEEEIHHNLLLSFPSCKVTNEADELIRLFQTLYVTPGEYKEFISDSQKNITIKANLERYIRKSLERNIFRYGKISNRDDDDWYHALKASVEFESDEFLND